MAMARPTPLDPPGRLGQGSALRTERPFDMSKKPAPPPTAAAASGGILAGIARRPRLLIGAALMVATYLLSLWFPFVLRQPTRLLIAWNVGAWAFLVMIAQMMADPRRHARAQAAPEDEDQWTLVFLGIVASWAAVAAIVWELGRVKEMAGLLKAGHLTLVAATILSAWTFLNVMFALHYAGVYFQPLSGKIRGGLDFPGQPRAGVGRIRLSGLRHRLHLRQLRRQCHLDADAPHCRDPGRGVVLLQRDHSRPHHQYRGKLVLRRRDRRNGTFDDRIRRPEPGPRRAAARPRSTATPPTSPRPKR